jgi:SAM-dependent methyltransferase
VAQSREEVLRRLMPSRMKVFPYAFPLTPEWCPCDVHFCDYLGERGIRGQSIFHFGSGGHHLVGLRNSAAGTANDILAITASPGEIKRYVNLVVTTATLGRHYRVLFADIYDLSEAALPEFDIVTLFHLCEYSRRRGPERATRMDDADVLELFRSKLKAGGRLVFYAGSDGREETGGLIAQAVSEGRIAFEEQYKSLLVYRRC